MSAPAATVPPQTILGLFGRFLRFGLLAWGGPIAQIAMLRRELVDRERWIGSERFNRTLAVYQALPGPEAHELCVYFGTLARGRWGGIVAGLGFMLPGFVLMLAASAFYVSFGLGSPWVAAAFAGCQAAVLALIVRAVLRLGRHGVSTVWLGAIALLAFVASLLGASFVAVLVGAGIAHVAMAAGGGRVRAMALAGLAVVLVGAVLLGSFGMPMGDGARGVDGTGAEPTGEDGASAGALEIVATGARAGLLTFGGAYTAIPFVQHDAVASGGWMSTSVFLDGVAIAGILPAPLIIFVTFVGFVAGGPIGALLITAAAFLPAFGFTLLGHRHLERLVEAPRAHAFLDGVMAGVVGLIAATVLILAPTAYRGIGSVAIFALALLALSVRPGNATIPLVVAASGVVGLVLFGPI